MTFDVVVLPGDGIEPEVVAEAVRVLRRVEELSGGEVALSLETFAAGAGAWRRGGAAIADDVYAACEAADAILLGAAGLPDARAGTAGRPAPTSSSGCASASTSTPGSGRSASMRACPRRCGRRRTGSTTCSCART